MKTMEAVCGVSRARPRSELVVGDSMGLGRLVDLECAVGLGDSA